MAKNEIFTDSVQNYITFLEYNRNKSFKTNFKFVCHTFDLYYAEVFNGLALTINKKYFKRVIVASK